MQHKTLEKDVEDPVCGMRVNARTVKYKVNFNGKTYHFCSLACEAKFKKNPEMYVG